MKSSFWSFLQMGKTYNVPVLIGFLQILGGNRYSILTLEMWYTELVNSANNPVTIETVLAEYLGDAKPTLQQIAKKYNLGDRVVGKILIRGIEPKRFKQEKSLRYSRSKVGDANPMKGKFLDQHHNYKGVCEGPGGYPVVLWPAWFKGQPSQKHVPMHHVVMCEALGITQVPKGMDVHHIDENIKNFDIHNLVIGTKRAHHLLHAQSPLRKLSLWELHRSGISK